MGFAIREPIALVGRSLLRRPDQARRLRASDAVRMKMQKG